MSVLLTHRYYFKHVFLCVNWNRLEAINIDTLNSASWLDTQFSSWWALTQMIMTFITLLQHQINQLFFINLNHLDIHTEVLFFLQWKYVISNSRNNPHLRFVDDAGAEHRVGFATACLAIGDDGWVVAVKSLLDDIFAGILIYLLLSDTRRIYLIKRKNRICHQWILNLYHFISLIEFNGSRILVLFGVDQGSKSHHNFHGTQTSSSVWWFWPDFNFERRLSRRRRNRRSLTWFKLLLKPRFILRTVIWRLPWTFLCFLPYLIWEGVVHNSFYK